MGRFNSYPDDELQTKLKAFANAFGLEWFHYSEALSGYIDEELMPEGPFVTKKELNQVKGIATQLKGEVSALRSDFALLLDHLGVTIEAKGRTIVKQTTPTPKRTATTKGKK